jgi:hypothetical protein
MTHKPDTPEEAKKRQDRKAEIEKNGIRREIKKRLRELSHDHRPSSSAGSRVAQKSLLYARAIIEVSFEAEGKEAPSDAKLVVDIIEELTKACED